jgi:predicted glycosyltransferase involved in capsule biosynthesis
MSVVQKDPIISGMLEDERERCANAIEALAQKASEYPKGSIHFRKVKSQKKQYAYPFLKYREGGRSVFKHIPQEDLKSVQEQIQKRKKIEEEIKKAKDRLRYLNRLLAKEKRGRPRKEGK